MKQILVSLMSFYLGSCASTPKDFYQNLQSSKFCKASISDIAVGNAPVIPFHSEKGVEVDLDDNKCVQVENLRSSYGVFRFVAKTTEQKLRLRIYPKGSFGFGGSLSLINPVVVLKNLTTSQTVVFPESEFEFVKNNWTGHRYFFDFSLNGMVVGQNYALIVYSDNSQLGKGFMSRKVNNAALGVVGGTIFQVDESVFYGPYSEVEAFFLRQ